MSFQKIPNFRNYVGYGSKHHNMTLMLSHTKQKKTPSNPKYAVSLYCIKRATSEACFVWKFINLWYPTKIHVCIRHQLSRSQRRSGYASEHISIHYCDKKYWKNFHLEKQHSFLGLGMNWMFYLLKVLPGAAGIYSKTKVHNCPPNVRVFNFWGDVHNFKPLHWMLDSGLLHKS